MPKMSHPSLLVLVAAMLTTNGLAFVPVAPRSSSTSTGYNVNQRMLLSTSTTRTFMTIVSPFDNNDASGDSDSDDEGVTVVATKPDSVGPGPFELTWDNVDMVLEEMRPYLIQDGGNVKISEIDGPIVRLELEGACGTCPSSTQTLKMGLERGLMEKIPEIQEVIQAMPEGPPLNQEQVDVILDGVRPFLSVAGGSIDLDRIEGEGGLQPSIYLEMKGNSASLNSVKLEIAQRLQKHFMMAGLHVEWVEEKK